MPREPRPSDATGELSPPVQLLITGLLAAACVLTVRPLGVSGAGLYGLLLLVLSTLALSSRVLPLERFGADLRYASMLVAAVVTGLFYGFDVSSWAVSFAYAPSFAAGVRLPQHRAYVVAGLTTVVALAATWASGAVGEGWPWWACLTVFLPVFIGMSRRAAAVQLAAARELVAQTERARAAERETLALQERTRLARELHDVLAHSLTGVGLQLDLAEAQLEAGQDAQAQQTVARARSLTKDGVDEARAVITALREDSTTLPEALRRLMQDPEQLTVGELTQEPTDAVRHALVRITQEAITNARRHAPDAPARVSLSQQPDGWRLLVVNGPSADPGVTGSGMGLIGIRERVTGLGGTVEIGARADGGWQVDAWIPLGDK